MPRRSEAEGIIPQLCWVIVHTHPKSTSDSRGNREPPSTELFAHRRNGPPMVAAFVIPILMVIVVVIVMVMVDAGVEADGNFHSARNLRYSE